MKLLLCLLVLGCAGPAESSPSADTPPESLAETHAQGQRDEGQLDEGQLDEGQFDEGNLQPSSLCLPMVSGCGCSSMCAQAVEDLGEGRYHVTHAGQRSRLDVGTLSRWCFTDAGVGTLLVDGESTPPDTRCVDAFWVGACAGVCIPTPVPSCTHVNGSCQAH